MTTSKPTIAIACGGTGGHFFPGLSIARELQRQGAHPVLFIGGHHVAEQIATAREMGIAAVESPAIRLPANRLKWPLALAKLLRCVSRNRRLLQEHKVDAALGMGSFASVPMITAAARLRLPLFLHEGNARLGRANRWLARRASLLMLSFPLRNAEVTAARQLVVGMPVRNQLRGAARRPVDDAARQRLRQQLGLDPALSTLLVFGGSQGAQFLNQLIGPSLAAMGEDRRRLQLIHLTGSQGQQDFERIYSELGVQTLVKPTEPQIEQLYQAADLVLCRAGASTIFELALFGKPAILVPLPTALDDHQRANAQIVVDAEAGIMIEESALTPDGLGSLLRQWLAEPLRYQRMSEQIQALAKPNATETIVAEIHAALGIEPTPAAPAT